MTKIVYNECHGGFGLSRAALRLYRNATGRTPDNGGQDLSRTDPTLVRIVETYPQHVVSDRYAALAIRDLPPGTRYRIDECDGAESVITIDEHEWLVA